MTKLIKAVGFVLVLILSATLLFSCKEDSFENPVNHFEDYAVPEVMDSGWSWDETQALPRFSTPYKVQKTVVSLILSPDERILFSGLQGLVNRQNVEITMLENEGENKVDTKWMHDLGLERNDYSSEERRYELISEYADRADGVVLYDASKNIHYRNAASTVAGVYGYLPVDASLLDKVAAAGVRLSDDNVIDLSVWDETETIDIYTRIYEEYWRYCSKRLIIVANPSHDLDHCRDMAITVKAAVVYLDTMDKGAESALYEKFCKDMADDPSTSIILGWGVTERSAVCLASRYGIGLIPSDYFYNATVHSGVNPEIDIKPIPKRDKAENKVYISVFFSDGDNIQYNQRAMRGYWERDAEFRGVTPVTWTISPSLVDIAPGILNYYYNNSTDYECFATGPSGMGYMMPINTFFDPHRGQQLKNEQYAENYAVQTSRYIQRAGIRVITCWDDLPPFVRTIYEKNLRSLWGATIHQFYEYLPPFVKPSVENDRLRFERLRSPYDSDTVFFEKDSVSNIDKWINNGADTPLFLAYQLNAWEVGTSAVIGLERWLKEKYGADTVEFVRADHYFQLYNEANGYQHNLLGLKDVEAVSSDGTICAAAFDGTPKTVWSTDAKDASVTFDLKKEYTLTKYVMTLGEAAFLGKNTNLSSWIIECSTDGVNYQAVSEVRNNTVKAADIEFDGIITARYVRIICKKGGADGRVYLPDIEIYGM